MPEDFSFKYDPKYYDELVAKRVKRLAEITNNPAFIKFELELCKQDFFHWCHNWVFTYNPQNVGSDISPWLPFVLFPKQVELIKFFDARLANTEDGLIEKSRETGYSWVTVAWAVHKWRFVEGFVSTFTANKEDSVDKIGNSKSLFEKARLLLKFLPVWMLPFGFKFGQHDSFMRIVNPENGNIMNGEAGEQAGRGGRSTVVFLDEAAFIENAERVEAATSANAKTRIWGSTVNGMGNLFARKRFGGKLRPEQIFRLHWKDDPRKTEEWAKKERLRLEDHIWASEYDLDYSASVEGICIPAKWVNAAKEIRKHIKVEPEIEGVSGGDVGGGKAKSTVVTRFGSVVVLPEAWMDPDTVETAFRMLDAVQNAKIENSNGTICRSHVLYFDSISVGQGVLSVLTKHDKDDLLTIPVNTGEPPSDMFWSDQKTSKEKFYNSKAELWFICRERFKCTYEYLLYLQGQPGGISHDHSEIIILPDDGEGPHAIQLASELSLPKWTRNERGKIVMERKSAMIKRGIPSTDYADGLILTFAGGNALETWAKLGS